jgi:hypothetical protein
MAVALATQPQTIVTLDPKHRLIEGVATDGRTIWVSSVLDRQLVACRTECRTMATLQAGLHPFAIVWDRTRQRLWVAADCPPGVAGIKACERGALIGLDKRGRIRTRIAPLVGAFHPGDVSSAGGELFVSDSQNGAVYRLTAAGRALAAVVLPGVGKSGQGTALDGDKKRLLVADYSQGIASIELATGARTLLMRQDGKPLRGVDGLVRCGSTYYGIYNAVAPGALLSIVRTAQGIEVDRPLGEFTLPDPTQVAFDGKRLLIIPDSGWATVDRPDFKRLRGARILAIPLSADCRPRP